jgi:hypothetical protein
MTDVCVMGQNGKLGSIWKRSGENCMSHFTDEYMDRVSAILHNVLTPTWFYKQEIIEIPGLVTAVFITYDGLRDDSREIRDQCSWEDFQQRLLAVSDWGLEPEFLKEMIQKNSAMAMGGWERRTIYLMRAGSRPEHWTADKANEDVLALLMSSAKTTGKVLQMETEHLREIVPPGPEHFRAFEHVVRVVFNYLFIGELGEGKSQSRTLPEDEGVEIRDLIFANNAESGFWNDLKRKYAASEIVVDAKNKEELTRDDLRQLYCYLKPALGLWGFIVCRSEQSPTINAFNRTLYRNFSQTRGLLILTDDDLRRMVQIKMRGQNAATYLQDRMSEFVRSI